MVESILTIMNDENLITNKLTNQKNWINENTWEKGMNKILKILN
jgi:hypothetical protein